MTNDEPTAAFLRTRASQIRNLARYVSRPDDNERLVDYADELDARADKIEPPEP